MKKDWVMILSLLFIIGLLIGFKKPIKKLMTRGYTNKNPGNIRLTVELWKGEVKGKDKAFKTFQTMGWGYRAIFVLLSTYIRVKGLNTIRKIINTYAPSNENNTTAYITTVSKKTGLDADEVINWSDENNIINIVAAISYVENGIAPDLTDINNGLTLYKTA